MENALKRTASRRFPFLRFSFNVSQVIYNCQEYRFFLDDSLRSVNHAGPLTVHSTGEEIQQVEEDFSIEEEPELIGLHVV